MTFDDWRYYTGGTSRAQWEDVTGSTPLTFVNDCVSFTTTVSARFWLMDCRNIGDATKMATELYRWDDIVLFLHDILCFMKNISRIFDAEYQNFPECEALCFIKDVNFKFNAKKWKAISRKYVNHFENSGTDIW